jgi:hypothetical protein
VTSVLDDPAYQIEFSFTDENGREMSMPLREMEPVECLWALCWLTEPGDGDVVRCLMDLLTIGMPAWPDGMSVDAAVHRYWSTGGWRTVQ